MRSRSPCLFDEVDGGQRHQVRLQSQLDQAPASGDRRHPRDERPSPPAMHPRPAAATAKRGSMRVAATASSGPDSMANSATKRMRNAPRIPSAGTRQKKPGRANTRQGGHQAGQQPRGDKPGHQEKERAVERPRRMPVLLQRPQVRHAEVIGDVGKAMDSRRRGEHDRNHRQGHDQRPPRLVGEPVAPRPEGVEQKQRGREEVARVGVGPHQPGGHQQPQHARLAGLGAFDGQQAPAPDPRKVTRCGRSTKRGSAAHAARAKSSAANAGSAPRRTATRKSTAQCAEHEGRLEQHGARNARPRDGPARARSETARPG